MKIVEKLLCWSVDIAHILNALNSLKDMEKNFSAGNAVI
jgi:hypothetical protein